MQQAAEAGNREHIPAILSAFTLTADETPASLKSGVREWDGGQSHDPEVVPDRPQPAWGSSRGRP